MRSQPLLAVADVEAASAWYRDVLGAASGHGGDEYERVMIGDDFILQLHRLDEAHHHGEFADPDQPLGNGVLVWFETGSSDAFDAAVERVRSLDPEIVVDVHVNPNARHREIWFRDLDGYTVVLAAPDGDTPVS